MNENYYIDKLEDLLKKREYLSDEFQQQLDLILLQIEAIYKSLPKKHKIQLKDDQNEEEIAEFGYGQLKSQKYAKLNNPTIKNYNLKCELCNQSGNNKKGHLKIFNVDDNTVNIYLHEQCALWTNGLYFFEKEQEGQIQPKNLIEIINQSKQQKCEICNQIGASLKCSKQNCDKVFHFFCFMEQEKYGKINDQQYSITCNEKHQKNPTNKQKQKDQKISEKNTQKYQSTHNNYNNQNIQHSQYTQQYQELKTIFDQFQQRYFTMDKLT